jgi:peptide-methionine (S)-S-oxide reductase
MRRRFLLLLLWPLAACAEPASNLDESSTNVTASHETAPNEPSHDSASSEPAAAQPRATTEVATFGAGCYWCVEAVLEQLEGVLDVTSGFMGGHVEKPSYKAVCSGTTGHAEVVQVTFDPAKLSYDGLLKWFWKLHDPTTLNRQGGDVGTQYRSAIFVHSDAQRKAAEASMKAAQADFKDPIVTEITPASAYYEAEDYHQDYYVNNKTQGYCRAVIAPKLHKLGLED